MYRSPPITVRVARAGASADTQTSPRGADPRWDLGPSPASHHAVTELLVQASDQGGREQAHLRRPGRRVGGDEHLAILETLRPGMHGQVGTDDLPGQRPKTPPTAADFSSPGPRAGPGSRGRTAPGHPPHASGPPHAAEARGGGVARVWRRRTSPGRASPAQGMRPWQPTPGETVHRLWTTLRQLTRVTLPSATSNRAPISSAGTSGRHGRGDQNLLGRGDDLGEPPRRWVSSSAKTSSRINTGSPPSARSRS